MDLADDRVAAAYIRRFIALKTRAAMGIVEAAPVVRIIRANFCVSSKSDDKNCSNYLFVFLSNQIVFFFLYGYKSRSKLNSTDVNW